MEKNTTTLIKKRDFDLDKALKYQQEALEMQEAIG